MTCVDRRLLDCWRLRLRGSETGGDGDRFGVKQLLRRPRTSSEARVACSCVGLLLPHLCNLLYWSAVFIDRNHLSKSLCSLVFLLGQETWV